MLNEVYNKRILQFAADIPLLERLSDADATATAVSRLCGSKVSVDIKMDGDVVSAFGHDVKACALGTGLVVNPGTQCGRLDRRGTAAGA